MPGHRGPVKKLAYLGSDAGEEMLRMVAAGADDHALQKHCKEKLGFHVSVRALCDWRNAQLEARGVAASKPPPQRSNSSSIKRSTNS